MQHHRRLLLTRRALGASLLAPAMARAQSYPSRPVRVLVAFAPGGQSDTVMRLIGPKMQEALGQNLVIENRPGGGGSVAGNAVAQAPPDGHTLLFDAFGFLVVPFIVKGLKPDYDSQFAPVGQAVSAPYVLAANARLGVRNLGEFLALARQKPGLSYGTPGVGTVGHLAGALLEHRAGIRLEHLPYRGGAEAARDVAGGQLDAAIATANSLRPVIEDGRAVGLALTSGQRMGTLSTLPTIAESGFPGFDLTSWNGIFAPAGTPIAAVERVAAAMQAAVTDPATRDRLVLAGNEPVTEGPAAFAARIAREREVVRQIVAMTGMKAE